MSLTSTLYNIDGGQWENSKMDIGNINESLLLQLTELEMLSSMYSNEGEFRITDPGVVSEIQDILSGKIEKSEVQILEYMIHLDIQGVKDKVKEVFRNYCHHLLPFLG